MTLSYLSSFAVIKYGIERNERDVPKTIIKDLEVLEKRIIDELTGQFTYTDPDYDSKMDIEWSPGEWRFTLMNQEPVKIRTGRRENLGLAGGDLFLFEGRKISIDDFNIDLEEKKIKFFGKCSSVKTSLGREFKSTFSFIKFLGRDAMKVNSELIGKFGLKKAKEKIFSRAGFEWMTVNFGAESDSDSSIDFEDELESDWDESHFDLDCEDESDQSEIGNEEGCEESESDQSEIGNEEGCEEAVGEADEADESLYLKSDSNSCMKYGVEHEYYDSEIDVDIVSFEDVGEVLKEVEYNEPQKENGYKMMFEGWATLCIFALIFAFLCY